MNWSSGLLMVSSYSFAFTLNDGPRRESLDQEVNCWWRMDVGSVRVRGTLISPERRSSTENRWSAWSASIRRTLEIERRKSLQPSSIEIGAKSHDSHVTPDCALRRIVLRRFRFHLDFKSETSHLGIATNANTTNAPRRRLRAPACLPV